MKKCYAILLSPALLVQLGVSVPAEGTGSIRQDGDTEIDVTAKYESSTVTLTISGTPKNSVTAEGIKVGTLKVTLGE